MPTSINIPTPGHPPYCEIYLPTETTAARFDDGFISFGASAISNPTYYVEDLLGSSRLMTTNNGTVCYDADFDPYGGEHAYTNTCSQNYKFEGKERDTETGNDDFGARYYTSRFGRWLSADWSSVPVPVPYANLTNPQTLNLYAMVSDDPESFADLDGHVQNASMGLVYPSEGGPTCAAGGAGGTGSANSASCGAGQTANQTEDQQQAEAAKQQAQNTTPAQTNNPKEDTLTNVVYNEAGSLSANSKAKPGAAGSAEQLHQARVEVAEVAERVLDSKHPGRVQADDTLSNQTLHDLAGGNKKVIAALRDSRSAAQSALGGSNLSNGAMHYRTSHHIVKKLYGQKAEHFGPFRDALGGKTYIMVAP